MPSLSSMPAFSTEGVVDSCRVSMVVSFALAAPNSRHTGRHTPADEEGCACPHNLVHVRVGRGFEGLGATAEVVGYSRMRGWRPAL